MPLEGMNDIIMSDTLTHISSRLFENNDSARAIMLSNNPVGTKLINIALIKAVDAITGDSKRELAKKDFKEGVITKEEYALIIKQLDEDAVYQRERINDVVRSVLDLIFPTQNRGVS